MSANALATIPSPSTDREPRKKGDSGKLLLGTGLVFASLILVPAFAARLGLGSSLTGALRIALMRASARTIGSKSEGSGAETVCMSCH